MPFPKMAMLALFGALILASGITVYGLSSGWPSSQMRWIAPVMDCVCLFGYFIALARFVKLRELLSVAILSGLLSVLFAQIIAFFFFPGWVKDVTPFGTEHIQLALSWAAGICILYLSIAISSYGYKLVFKLFKLGSE